MFRYFGSLSNTAPGATLVNEYKWNKTFNGYAGDVCWAGLMPGDPTASLPIDGVYPYINSNAGSSDVYPTGLTLGVTHSFTYIDSLNNLQKDVNSFNPSNLLAGTEVSVKVYTDRDALYSVSVSAPLGLGTDPVGLLFGLDTSSSNKITVNASARDGTALPLRMFNCDSSQNSLAQLVLTTNNLLTFEPYAILAGSTYFTRAVFVGERFDDSLQTYTKTSVNPQIICRMVTKNMASPYFWGKTYPVA